MKVAIGSDHGGFELKAHLVSVLLELGHVVADLGTDSLESVDYPDYGKAVGRAVVSGDADRGVVVCTTGLGIAMATNKVPGARCAVVHNEDAAHYSRSHNNANCIAFGQKYDTPYMAAKCLLRFLEADFEAGGRHERRVNQLEA